MEGGGGVTPVGGDWRGEVGEGGQREREWEKEINTHTHTKRSR